MEDDLLWSLFVTTYCFPLLIISQKKRLPQRRGQPIFFCVMLYRIKNGSHTCSLMRDV